MRPAIRSTFDIVAWLGERGGQSGTALKPPFLMQILYLSQALYASEHNQAKLMPATFLATDAGPIEPDLFLALEQGISVDAAVAPADHVEEVLIAVWDAYGQSDQEELRTALASDSAIKLATKRGRNSEILIDEMAAAYPGGLSNFKGQSRVSQFPDGSPYSVKHSNLDAVPSDKQEVRFTADGRSVTRWVPKKRIKSSDLS
ncbi:MULTISPECIES: Panacea domain-containing protein [Sneathiella]|jgi:uncharacterized phage-associated protein|uniref:hypothetical protein n=1 Tax=Sneathiella TaxID=510690 RepID=UPI00146A09D8|nr:hypothetical protein [Sneathiella aquimaris]